MDINSIGISGRSCADGELRDAGKVKVYVFRLANNSAYGGKDADGKTIRKPLFIDVEIFGRLAELADGMVKKGSEVYVEGELQMDQWEDKDSGAKRSKFKVNARNFKVLDRREKAGDSDDDDGDLPF